MKKIFYVMMAMATILFLTNRSPAAEYPEEHPGSPAEAEHKEEPREKTMLSADEIIEGIKNHINEVTKANWGFYPLEDAEEEKALRLKLIQVHEDTVSYIKKDDAYFACTDFISYDGQTKYDIDFWMKIDDNGEPRIYQTKIHKQDDTPRFTYKDDEIVPVE